MGILLNEHDPPAIGVHQHFYALDARAAGDVAGINAPPVSLDQSILFSVDGVAPIQVLTGR